MPAAAKQTIDAIDNYFPDGEDYDDPFASPPQSPAQSPNSKNKRKAQDGGLGIDEEVSVAKRARVPRVKLDEGRLLSDKGIPALRKRAAQLKLKGKGHEFGDAARLLSFYQLWLDDLFPKAKFLDALAMVEKTGHKTTMHKHRMDWINEAKPKPTNTGDGDDDDNAAADADGENPTTTTTAPREASRVAPIFERRPGGTVANAADVDALFGDGDDADGLYDMTPMPDRRQTAAGSGGGVPDDDDLDALMAEAEAEAASRPKPTGAEPTRSLFGGGKPTAGTGEPDDDDLDALMAEAEAEASTRPNAGNTTQGGGTVADKGKVKTVEMTEDDELEALMAEAEAGEPVRSKPAVAPAPKPAAKGSGDADFGDDEEAMAELEGLW